MNNASILQVNTSRGGVPKRAVPFGDVTPTGIQGDVQKHTEFHGGPLQALLIVTEEGLDELKRQGFEVFPGALGENVTTVGLNRKDLRIGSRIRLGEVVVEVTKMREPCRQISPYGQGIQKAVYDEKVKTGDHTSPRWGLAGFYVRILETGRIKPGDPIVLLAAQPAE